MAKNEIKYMFEGWFSICIPETWEYSIEENILSICLAKNAKGIIQISFFHLKEVDESLKETAEKHLNRFLNQYGVEVENNTYKVIEAQKFTVANASGKYNSDFIKVWTIVNTQKMLLITYICPRKTRELSIVEDIIYSIEFSPET